MACFMVATTPLTLTWSTWFKDVDGAVLDVSVRPEDAGVGDDDVDAAEALRGFGHGGLQGPPHR